jgi:hypothetical protein
MRQFAEYAGGVWEGPGEGEVSASIDFSNAEQTEIMANITTAMKGCIGSFKLSGPVTPSPLILRSTDAKFGLCSIAIQKGDGGDLALAELDGCIHYHGAACGFSGILRKVSFGEVWNGLNPHCQQAIYSRIPATESPKVYRTEDGGLGLSFRRDIVADDEERSAVQEMAAACPELSYAEFVGGLGAQWRWYIRRDSFRITHSRDSGLPGDYDRYWHQDKVPYDYDPAKD